MIGWLREQYGSDRLTPEDEAKLAFVEARTTGNEDGGASQGSGSGISDTDLADLAATVDALDSLGTVAAPRSFALTRESLAEAGYSERETERILAPAARRVGFWQRPLVQQMPLVLSALALLIGGVFLLDIGDESALDLNRETPDSAESAAPMAAMRVAVDESDVNDADTEMGVFSDAATPEIGQFADRALEPQAVMATESEDTTQPEGASATDGPGVRRMVREPSAAEEAGIESAVETAPRALQQQDDVQETSDESTTLPDSATVSTATTTIVDWLVPVAMFALALLGLLAWLALRRWRRLWS